MLTFEEKQKLISFLVSRLEVGLDNWNLNGWALWPCLNEAFFLFHYTGCTGEYYHDMVCFNCVEGFPITEGPAEVAGIKHHHQNDSYVINDFVKDLLLG